MNFIFQTLNLWKDTKKNPALLLLKMSLPYHISAKIYDPS